MKRFHKPGDEKRSLVIVHRRHYDDWLSCKNPEFARSFFHCYPASEMQAEVVKANQQVERQSSLFSHRKTITIDTKSLFLLIE
jgi:putative SOS response-associated peptidase YedK